ncbi:MAG: hypothetical protein ACYCT1_08600 [Steroidobacteraceae bacterium]
MPNIVPAASGTSGFTQGLLASLQPWLTGGSPSALNGAFAQDGGVTGLLSAMLQDSPGSQGAAAFGRALQTNQDQALQRAAARQGLASGQIKLEQQGMMLPFLRAYYSAAMGGNHPPGGASPAIPGAPSVPGSSVPPAAGAPSGTQPQPANPAALAPLIASNIGRAVGAGGTIPPPNQPPVSPTAGASIVAAPSGTPAPSATAVSPDLSRFAVPTDAQIGSIPIGGMAPNFYQLGAMLTGGNPLTAATQIHAEQVKLAQQQYGPALAQLDTLDKAQSPTQYVSASPALMAEWHQLAPSLGFDPAKGFTNANVRTAFSFLRNRIAGALGEPTVAPPVQLATSTGPLNSIFQRNPITGAIQQVKPEEGLKAVVGPNGTVRYVAASQAAGQTPYESELYAPPQSIAQTASMIANYQMAPLNGYALRTPIGAEIMAKVKELNPSYDATTYQTKQTARTAFATGKQGNIVRSLSVATNHLDQLAEAAHALAQSNIPAVNALVNTYARHTGSPGITSFNAMKEIVGDEVAKAVIGSGGAESDREAIKEAFHAANSPRQIQGVISHYEGLMGGQLSGLRRQYQRATGLDDFNSLVSQLARQKLTAASSASTRGTLPAPLAVGKATKVGAFTITRIK